MTAIMYEKLFEPYTKDGHTLENTFKYISNLAVQKGISSDVVELAFNEIFAEVANGKEFSKEKCSCGCGIDKAATELIHAIRDRMLEIDRVNTEAVKNLMQERYRLFLEQEMKRVSNFDKEYNKVLNGTAWNKVKKFVGMSYEHWENE